MTTLEARVNRIYAALDGIREQDLAKFPPTVIDEDGYTHVWQDFRGGKTDAELQNAVHILILNIGHLDDHLRKWAGKDSGKRSKIDDKLKSSQPFLVIKDLANNDKHGWPPRDGSGLSGLAPQLTSVHTFLQMTTRAEKGSFVGMVLTTEGPKIEGDGTADVVISGDVSALNGDPVGELHELATEATDLIEALLSELGIRTA